MKRFFLYILFLFPLFANSQIIDFSSYFTDKTLNILCYHSGRFAMEYYEIEEIYATNNWAGTKTKLLDNTNIGAHRIEVYAANTKNLIYSRNYCSLFEEWQTTPEAKKSCGNFEEVIRIPLPKEDIDILFFSRDSLGKWYKVEKKTIEVANINIKETNLKTDNFYPLHIASKDLNKKLDIVIVPAGYTKADSLQMIEDLKLFTKHFFSKPPFSNSQDKINIRGVSYFSEQSGIPGLDKAINPNTFLGVQYNIFDSPRYIMTPKLFNLHEILMDVPYEQIIIMCNSSVYGGGGIFNFYATSYVNRENGFVLIHEFGHSFGGLGDEYSETDIDIEGASQKIEPWQKNVTSLVDFSKKWEDMLDKTTPIPTPTTTDFKDKVGVFEGAAYVSKGLYRPFQDCLMRSDKPFCPVCTREINKMIDFYTE
ncbi:MAG TPA: peptidase M64 [Bacteroidales bacterium]|nr:peptidase M64 [Bacteroidales bacterium]